MILGREQGIYPSIAAHDYHRRILGTVSKSALEPLDRSPKHYKAWVDGRLDEEVTPALEFGSAFHCAILEPARFDAEYATQPAFGDLRTKAGKAARDEWLLQNGDRRAISAANADAIHAMRKEILAHELGSKLLAEGCPEVSVLWNDAETGLPCKARADYYVPRFKMLVDVKTSMNASLETFRRDSYRFGYHKQDALYRAGFAAVGERVEHFVLLVVEKEPPYAVAVFALDAEAVARGYADTRKGIDLLAQCVHEDRWPGYPPHIQELQLPAWA